ncbi:hypothetical protein K7X08_025079 [Anisodus acutangulus]|uniref:Neurochondrin n=1 Tax=Anisodus acutangulus TaxID=402998 RepID=A0A9Q1M9L3_9SOLA|nr:hypothetical protein K7X08_025079 [Anisodus acutangulus]
MNPSFAASRLDIPTAMQIMPQEEQASSSSGASSQLQPSLDDCLKLLRGERDEQRLGGLLLAALCRVPDIAASEYMVTMIPLIVETMYREESGSPSIIEELYEYLFLVSTANEEGIKTLYKSGGLNVLALHVMMSAMKFEALHLLSAILSNGYSAPVYDALRLMEDDVWSTNMQIGIVAILQYLVAPSYKLQALVLAECVMSIVGEGWLIREMNLTDSQDSLPADKCILLVLESSKVEITVLLNDLAYLKYEASNESSNRENILVKQRNLGVAFSLVEKIIKLISSFGGEESTSNAIIIATLSHWADGRDDACIIMMASSICSLILDLTSEVALLNHPDFTWGNIGSLSKLIGLSFAMCGQDLISDDAKVEVDLFQIITSAYASWANRFPRIRQAVESSGPLPSVLYL